MVRWIGLQFVIVVLPDHTYLFLSVTNGIVSSNNKWGGSNFYAVNLPFLCVAVPCSISYDCIYFAAYSFWGNTF